MAKKSYGMLPVIIAVAILLVVIYIVNRNEKSAVSRLTAWVSDAMEGFTTSVAEASAVPRCPAGYTFFNDQKGESFCCSGSVNPYSHTCTTNNYWGLCAFKRNATDPRNPGRVLPFCGNVIERNAAQNSQSFCPGDLPNYASAGKCCKHGTDNLGKDCVAVDLANTDNYCIVGTTGKPGERFCKNLKLAESANCPSGLQKTAYTLGAAERAKYGNFASVTIPICVGIKDTCIPNNVITKLQADGIYRDKTDLNNWKYACSNYEKVVIRRDLTGTQNTTYP